MEKGKNDWKIRLIILGLTFITIIEEIWLFAGIFGFMSILEIIELIKKQTGGQTKK